MFSATRILISLVLVASAVSCAAPKLSPFSAEHRGIREALESLYEAFCFDARDKPDWETQRLLFAKGANFIAPFQPGEEPVAVGADQFLSDFREFVRTSPLRETGYHERITNVRIDALGGIAHAFVTFEGFVPGELADRRGVDSIQLVSRNGEWLVASFSTQYETDEVAMPARFIMWDVR